MANWIGGLTGAAGLIGAFSDRRLKTDVKDIGRTHDKQKIYSYRLKGSNVPQIGMMADEVEEKAPEAVSRRSSTASSEFDMIEPREKQRRWECSAQPNRRDQCQLQHRCSLCHCNMRNHRT